MIITVCKIVKRHKTHNSNNLVFDYYSPDQFEELNEPVYGEINLRKQFTGDFYRTSQLYELNIVEIPDEKDKYQKCFRVTSARKSHKKSAIGYLEVELKKGDIRYIRVLNGAGTHLPLFLVLGTVILSGSLLGINHLSKGTQVVEPKPTLEFAQGDDWDGALPERYQESTDYQENIEIAGYTNLLVTNEHQQIDLINTDNNTVYQQYQVYLDGKELFNSKLIAPGKQVAWNAYKDLGNGNYQLEFHISTFDLETQAPCNGATQSVSLEVLKKG